MEAFDSSALLWKERPCKLPGLVLVAKILIVLFELVRIKVCCSPLKTPAPV